MQFAEICRKREELQVRHDFKTHIQAYFTLCMWSVVAKPTGEKTFVEWGNSLFAANSITGTTKATKKIAQYQSKIFYTEDTIKTLYNILAISQSYGIGWRQFFELMQQTAVEEGLTSKEECIDYIHEDVLRKFLGSFIKGFVNLMLELGFDPKIEVI
mmetsp:Transcript_124947/g.186608  ORF Transcript_124947/g.186608 Transcript_124947/m.186608 type:complete len:157 (+) Transcript_124947:213-683(+)